MELRKSFPDVDKVKTPFKCYIYCTNRRNEALWRYQGEYYFDTQFPNERPNKANGMVIGEFVCDALYWAVSHPDIFAGHPCFHRAAIESACMTLAEAQNYADGKNVYGWHISELVVYDKPKELSEFGMSRPPQSWCYVEELKR